MASEKGHIILAANDLAVGYFSKKRPNVISKDIQFSIAEGELVGLVGANGIGKSTLLRTLAGIQPKINGSILLKIIDFKIYPHAISFSAERRAHRSRCIEKPHGFRTGILGEAALYQLDGKII
jgi:ABC-type cobalamin/Fe3+-siderophores transport systems, ATPase components